MVVRALIMAPRCSRSQILSSTIRETVGGRHDRLRHAPVTGRMAGIFDHHQLASRRLPPCRSSMMGYITSTSRGRRWRKRHWFRGRAAICGKACSLKSWSGRCRLRYAEALTNSSTAWRWWPEASACCGMTTKPEKAIIGISVAGNSLFFQRYRPASGRFHCRRKRMAT